MRHHFTQRVSFFEPEIFGGFDAPTTPPPMFFLGIQREASPPICFGQSRLQRMRIIFVEPERANGVHESADDPPFELLPPLPAVAHRRTLQPRPVKGEILRGEDDELYERIGNRIRRLRTLAAGPNGEVIDIARSDPPGQKQSTYKPTEETSKKTETHLITPDSPVTFRTLLPEPGQWRVVPFGVFKRMLAPQLAHPERLPDFHRLPCQIRVFEVTAPQALDQLGKIILGETAARQLQFLAPAIVSQLQLGALLPPSQSHFAARAHGIALPGDRVFHLRLTNDPTAGETTPGAEATGINAAGYDQASVPSTKQSIPDEFVKPWEFLLSREQALYEVSRASTFLGSLGEKWRRAFHFASFRRALRQWQMLLNGKTPDEQLWSVRPPRRGLTHPFVRSWAKNAIELAGYDTHKMLIEWQVFWRRKEV